MTLHAVDVDPVAGGPLLSVPALVELLRAHGMTVSARQAYRLLEAGILPSKRVGGKRGTYLVHRAEVLDWLAFGDLNRLASRASAAPALSRDDLAQAVADGVRLLVRGLAEPTPLHRTEEAPR